ncbi:MAG: MFS transporter [Planctomycetes bacterium]|nr:MFS transporter [Planctomycetota bacterium]
MVLPLYALTLFVSAFLLFLVQPMIGKMILPRLGGTPQVWNTCVVFFQMALLAGYAYTHLATTRLTLKRQLLVHALLLLVPMAVLLPVGPFNITGFEPPPGANPIFYTLYFLMLVVGLPFFVVSTSAPLLQRWFASTGHAAAKDPYFLYGASNLGSMLALLLYPFVVEPFLPLRSQAWTWTVGYVVLALLIYLCASLVWKAPEPKLESLPPEPSPPEMPVPPVEQPSTAVQAGPPPGRHGKKKGGKWAAAARPSAKDKAEPEPEVFQPRPDVMTFWRRARWVLLSAVPSSLMLGIISYISTDLSPIPLFWVIPLALYLLTFILVFARYPVPWTLPNITRTSPHQIAAYVQPILIAGLCFIVVTHSVSPLLWTTLFSLLGFFFTALVCHGELARDRPSPKHLTEFYLWMSFGGMLGGMFNGLFAPLLFTGVAEYPLAIIAACFLRPKMKDDGWTDNLVENQLPGLAAAFRQRGTELAKSFEQPVPKGNFLLNYSLDIVLGLVVLALAYFARDIPRETIFKMLRGLGIRQESLANWTVKTHQLITIGIPLVICCIFFLSRPVRMGVGIAGFLFVSVFLAGNDESQLWAGRSYFGVIRVLERDEYLNERLLASLGVTDLKGLKRHEEDPKFVRTRQRSLLHGTTHHGLNYQSPRQLSRLATTYYHRMGPTGRVMEKLNWFPGPQNTYWADARMPASLTAMGATISGGVSLPIAPLLDCWSEPPYATVGLGTGTMASYGRPFQHVTFYEIDDTIRGFSLPKEDMTGFYNYLQDAIKRGSNVEVIMGDARLSMQVETPREGGMFPKRDNYYRVIELDAFSSDAIPVHLITKEAIEMYFKKLTQDGVLCVHTSNRHVDLVQPVTDIAKELGLAYRVGKDSGEGRGEGGGSGYLGHFGSEYVMIARDDKYLPPEGTVESELNGNAYMTWSTPDAPGSRIWTDDYSNLASILRENFAMYLLLLLLVKIGAFVIVSIFATKTATR